MKTNLLKRLAGVVLTVAMLLTVLPMGMVVHAEDVAPYTITFHRNNGAGGADMPPITGILESASQKLTKNTFTRTDYEFTGWNTEQNPTDTEPGKPYIDEDTINDVTANIILYAQWVRIYTITYHPNGGSGNNIVDTVRKGGIHTVKANNTFTRTGQTSLGWNTIQQPPATSRVSHKPGDEIKYEDLDANIILYAQWVAAQHPVTFNPGDGGTGTMPTNITVAHGTFYPLPQNGFTPPANKLFLGWRTSINGDRIMYPGDNIGTINAPLTLTAIWADKRTVKFDNNGGDGTMADVEVAEGSTYTPPAANDVTFTPPEEPEGLEFRGWSTSADGIIPVRNIKIEGDITFYAIWREPANPAQGIDYSFVNAPALVRPNSGSGYNAQDFSINLSKMPEEITIPESYTIMAYSTDGGTKWKAAKPAVFSAAKFNKLLNKELTLHLSDKAIEKETKQPPSDAVIVKFPKIDKRPKITKLVVNYAIGDDITGELEGTWVLTEKDGTSSVKAGMEVAVAAANRKTPDDNGFGRFIGGNGTKEGIIVMPLTGTKVAKTTYLIRNGPTPASGNITSGNITPASKFRRINVAGEQKAPKYKVNVKNGIIKLKANTYTKVGSANAVRNAEKSEWDKVGDVIVWTAATAKKPASAKQFLNVPPPTTTTTAAAATP